MELVIKIAAIGIIVAVLQQILRYGILIWKS